MTTPAPPSRRSHPTTVYPPGTAESAFAASPAGAEQDVFAAPTMVSSAPSADLFASPGQRRARAGRLAVVLVRCGRADGVSPVHGNGASGLTGQRHENSVLFSLSNLEALAAPSSAPSSLAPRPGLSNTGGSEGSGLIDIRSMAQMTLGSQGETRMSNDLPTFGVPQFSPVAPVLLPMGPSAGPSKWVIGAAALGVVLAIVMGAAAFTILRKPNAPAPVAAPPVVATTAAPAPAPAAANPAQPAVAPPVTPAGAEQ
jgi:hypothetical protein